MTIEAPAGGLEGRTNAPIPPREPIRNATLAVIVDSGLNVRTSIFDKAKDAFGTRFIREDYFLFNGGSTTGLREKHGIVIPGIDCFVTLVDEQ